MIDAIYLIRYAALAQARLKAKCWIVDEQGVSRILKIITSVARVWAAFRESSYEEGPTKWEVHSKYYKKCISASKIE